MENNQSVRRHLDAFTRGRIIGKLEEGRSVTSVAAEFGIAHSICWRLLTELATSGLPEKTYVTRWNEGRTRITKDYITLKSKLDNIKSIIKELDILQNDYCALPDKINLNDALDSLSDLQDEAEETKLSLVLLSNYESKIETVNNTSKNTHVKLPDLPLPIFSGKFQEFE
ncbi:DUF1758 domain-containing protein [Trichonephila clavipes]|nr:DUF1758 domain-containing protein [Trichonephila clavipes]